MKELIEEKGGLTSELKAKSLSNGQKQLFCLARTVLRKRTRDRLLAETHAKLDPQSEGVASVTNGGILILDEFNAGVDDKTDEMMQAVICREFARYTVLCVAHKLDTIMDYDRVVVMEKGEMIEVGNPKELYGQMGSRFRGLWREGE